MRVPKWLRVSIAGVMVMLSGCGGGVGMGRPATDQSGSSVLVRQADLPPPTASNLPGRDLINYVIGPFDRLSVQVYNLPEVKLDDVQVDNGGRIAVPLAGSVMAAGTTTTELSDRIAAALRAKFVRDPQVTVNINEAKSQLFTIDGQVREPGNYPVVGRISLVEAIASAKGLSEFAKEENVFVFRNVGAQRMAGVYNIKAIRAGAYDDPQIFANDVIIVGDSAAKRLRKDFIQVLPALTSPLIYLFR